MEKYQLAVHRLQSVMDDAVRRGEAPCCTLAVKKDGKEIVYLEAGYADLEGKKPVRRDSIFRLYSMSKPITAAAMMLLVERGLVDLGEPVSRYLPGFKDQTVEKNGKTEPVQREMTIQDLMNMTSGLVYGGEDAAGRETEALFAEVIDGLQEGNGGTIGTVEFANRLGRCKLSFQPGSAFMYGTSADVIGAVIEVVSGMRFGDFLRKEFFEPLGMVDTHFYVPEEKQERLVKTYACEEGKEAELFTGDHLGIWNCMAVRPAFESGGAGLASTVDDYLRFADMLQNQGSYEGRQILLPETVRFLTSGHLAPWQQKNLDAWTGLGGFTYGNFMRVMVEPERAVSISSKGEYGWDGWLGCYFANAPERKLTIVMMTQKKDAGTFALTRKLRNIIFSTM